jgi:hypothetical protein
MSLLLRTKTFGCRVRSPGTLDGSVDGTAIALSARNRLFSDPGTKVNRRIHYQFSKADTFDLAVSSDSTLVESTIEKRL